VITITEVRDHIRFEPNQEGQIALAIGSVVELFEAQTCRLWSRRVDHAYRVQVYEEYIDRLWCPLTPIESLEIKEWFKWEGPAKAKVLEQNSEYIYDASTGRITKIRMSRFSDFVDIKVTGGYTAETAPAKIKMALLEQLKFAYSRFNTGNTAATSKSVNKSFTFFLNQGLHDFFQAVVIQERRDHG
jgi:hypothetical protein